MATTTPATGPPEPLPALDPQFIEKILASSGDPRIESWKLLVRAVDQSALIHRFSDKAQTSFTGTPLPDGSNLDTRTLIPGGGVETNGSVSLQHTFGYYRQWLTWLHYKELLRYGVQSWVVPKVTARALTLSNLRRTSMDLNKDVRSIALLSVAGWML